ncbi:MAG: ribose-5-phosphate isomerase RpiA [Neomegalonema sp.]|nr:ribose-5-phosphate isomerase RpiA [Neomegalonema sp.]
MPNSSSPKHHGDGADLAKKTAAYKAVELVEHGMKVGIGTGSTAAWFVNALGKRVAEGVKIVGVPTSVATGRLAEKHKIPLTTLDEAGWLDLTVDGADEIDPHLNLIKGGGGALLQEKIVANASDRFVVIADASKRVDRLGAFALPVEITPFAWETTRAIIERIAFNGVEGDDLSALRLKNDAPFITDEGNFIVDLNMKVIDDPKTLAATLNNVPGVVDNGLFIGMAERAIIANEAGEVDVISAL